MERGQDPAAGAAGILAVAAGWQRVHHPQVAGAAAGGGTTQRYAWCLKNKENPCEGNPHRGIFFASFGIVFPQNILSNKVDFVLHAHRCVGLRHGRRFYPHEFLAEPYRHRINGGAKFGAQRGHLLVQGGFHVNPYICHCHNNYPLLKYIEAGGLE